MFAKNQTVNKTFNIKLLCEDIKLLCEDGFIYITLSDIKHYQHDNYGIETVKLITFNYDSISLWILWFINKGYMLYLFVICIFS